MCAWRDLRSLLMGALQSAPAAAIRGGASGGPADWLRVPFGVALFERDFVGPRALGLTGVDDPRWTPAPTDGEIAANCDCDAGTRFAELMVHRQDAGGGGGDEPVTVGVSRGGGRTAAGAQAGDGRT